MKHHPLKKKKGFTLPEIITVIVVIAVLAGIGTWLTGNIREQAIENAKVQNADMVNRLINSMRSAGLTIATTTGAGAWTVTGATSANLTLNGTPASNATALTNMLTSLNSGVSLSGINFRLGRALTNTSYTLGETGGNPIIQPVTGPTAQP